MFSVGPINESSKKLFSPAKLLRSIPLPHTHSCLHQRPTPFLPQSPGRHLFSSLSLKAIPGQIKAEAEVAFLKSRQLVHSTGEFAPIYHRASHLLGNSALALQNGIVLCWRDISHLRYASQFCVMMKKYPR